MIIAKNVCKLYKNGAVNVLKSVSLNVSDGEFVVIVGASGSGKSTLMNVLSGLECIDSGNIFYNSVNLADMTDKQLTEFRRKEVGFVFQQYYLLSNLSVDKNVRLGADLIGNKSYQDIIEKVGLSDKIKSQIGRAHV